MFGSAAVLMAGLWLAMPADAANDIMKECGTKYQAAKAGNTLGGKNWAQFLAQCRGSQSAAAPVAAPAPVATAAAAKPATHQPRTQSPAMVAMHDRQRKCGQQWSADKAAGKVPAGQKWPQYWSACNTRLKG
jgi:hypothetical protein